MSVVLSCNEVYQVISDEKNNTPEENDSIICHQNLESRDMTERYESKDIPHFS